MCLHCGYFPVGNAFGDELECFFQTVNDTVNYDWHSFHFPLAELGEKPFGSDCILTKCVQARTLLVPRNPYPELHLDE